jgi:hypothetical protein
LLRELRSVRRFLLSLSLLLSAADPSRGQAPLQPPPYIGERLRFSMAIVGVTGGELTLSASMSQLSGKPVYKLEMSAISNDVLSKVFLVRDYMASWVDPETFRSLRFEKHTVEGKRVRDDLIEFDYEKGVAYRDGKPIPITNPTYDALSSVYSLRRLDLSGSAPVELNVVSRQLHTVRVEVQGRETITTPAGTFRTIRVEPKSSGEGGLIGKGKNLVIWLTDDERKMPVQLRSKLKVGTLVGKLRAVEKR